MKAICLVSMVQLLLPYPRMAQGLPPQNDVRVASAPVAPHAAATASGPGQHAFNMDLSSTAGVLAPINLANRSPVSILVGQSTMSISSATMLTPAERIALFQVINAGRQTLQIGTMGNAIGGSFTIGSRLSQSLSGLVIPQGETAISNIASNGGLKIAGNLTNSGALYSVSTDSAVTNAVMEATNIINNASGLLSTVLPSGGLPGITGALSNVSLSLKASENIVNSGTISSAGNLNLTAGGSIINADKGAGFASTLQTTSPP